MWTRTLSYMAGLVPERLNEDWCGIFWLISVHQQLQYGYEDDAVCTGAQVISDYLEKRFRVRGGGAWESSSVVSNVPVISGEAVNFVPHWSAAQRSNEYSSSNISMDVPRYGTVMSGPMPYPGPSAATNFYAHYYAGQQSSSNPQRHSINGVASCGVDPVMGSGRGPFKRKVPVIPDVSERGDTSRYYITTLELEVILIILFILKYNRRSLILHSQHRPWDSIGTHPSYNGCSLSIAEGSDRADIL